MGAAFVGAGLCRDPTVDGTFGRGVNPLLHAGALRLDGTNENEFVFAGSWITGVLHAAVGLRKSADSSIARFSLSVSPNPSSSSRWRPSSAAFYPLVML